MEHTISPWRAVFRGMDQEAGWSSRIPYAIEREVGSAVQPIADVCDQPEAEANANLIAAAPELLAAVADVLDTLQNAPPVELKKHLAECYMKCLNAYTKAYSGAA